MKPKYFVVTFPEHYSVDRVATMAADLNYWAPVRERITDRVYLVQVQRENKLALFRGRLAQGDRSGWWHWSEAE